MPPSTTTLRPLWCANLEELAAELDMQREFSNRGEMHISFYANGSVYTRVHTTVWLMSAQNATLGRDCHRFVIDVPDKVWLRLQREHVRQYLPSLARPMRRAATMLMRTPCRETRDGIRTPTWGKGTEPQVTRVLQSGDRRIAEIIREHADSTVIEVNVNGRTRCFAYGRIVGDTLLIDITPIVPIAVSDLQEAWRKFLGYVI